jgi:hypothetical protein
MVNFHDSLPNPNRFDPLGSDEFNIFANLLDDPAVDVYDHVLRDEPLGQGPDHRRFPVSSSAPAIDPPAFADQSTDNPHGQRVDSDGSDSAFAISKWPDNGFPEFDFLAASYGTAAETETHSLPALAPLPQSQPVQEVPTNDVLPFPDFDATGIQTNDPIYWPVPVLPFLPTGQIAMDETAVDFHLAFPENSSIPGPQPALPTNLPWTADVSPAMLPTFDANALLPLMIPDDDLQPFNQSAPSASEDRSQPLFPLDLIDSLQSRPHPEIVSLEPPVHVAPADLQLRTGQVIESHFEGPSGFAIYPSPYQSTGDGPVLQRSSDLEDAPPLEAYSPPTIATFRRDVEDIIASSSAPSIPRGTPQGGAYITSEDDTQIELIPSPSGRYVCSPEFLTNTEMPISLMKDCTRSRRPALTARVMSLSVHYNLRRLINPNSGCVHLVQRLRIHPRKRRQNPKGTF